MFLYPPRYITFREFQVGEHVFLKVREKKSSLKLGSCNKLTTRYCGPLNILRRIGPLSYDLALPPNIKAHDFFHVSLLKKYAHNLNFIIDWNII